MSCDNFLPKDVESTIFLFLFFLHITIFSKYLKIINAYKTIYSKCNNSSCLYHDQFSYKFSPNIWEKNAVKNVYETTYSTNNNFMLLLSFSINFHQKR